MDDGARDIASPFHEGEQQVQERLGVRDRIEAFAQRVVTDHMPDQHREFYQALPFVMLGTVDDHGQPWASLVPGRPGFITSPDARTLDFAVSPLFADPLHSTLKPGAEAGLLGIQLETRRRNRLTGQVTAIGPGSFSIGIRQAFGNCPQYIQTRTVDLLPGIGDAAAERPVYRSDRFDARTRAMIEQSDTLFIATSYVAPDAGSSSGADVSHRGGRPGFVKIEDDRSFVFPDFSGNNHFNTIGNILLNPKAGFLFADFESGDVLYLTGDAEIVWDGKEVAAFQGAERLIRFTASSVIRVDASLPLRFAFGDFSPMLDHTGTWAQTAETIAADRERNVYLPFEIFDIKHESDTISSFYVRRADNKALASCEPGQFLPIRLKIPGQDAPVTRTYTVSDTSNADHYRLSIKREGGDALVSNFLHREVEPGYRLEAMAPRGKFTLDQTSDRPVVLISAGVGITPMIAMTNALIKEGQRTRNFRRTYFIHGAGNGRVHAFGAEIRRLAAEHETLISHIRYSNPDVDDRVGETHDSEGRVDIELLKQILPFDDFDFYLCGPQAFMQMLHDGLSDLGVAGQRIHYESFGPATVLRQDTPPKAKAMPGDGPIAVSFNASDVAAEWTPAKGTLLELAEAAGLAPAFSCRSGICGSCATRITCGKVDYIDEPVAPHGDDEVLICCSTPRSNAGEDSCGKDHGVVLEL